MKLFCLLLLIGGLSAQSVVPLSNGVPVTGNVPKEGFLYYSVSSETLGGLVLTVTQTSGTVYVYVGEDFVPSLQNSSYSLINSNSIKSLNVSLYIGTFYIGVYGFSSASFRIVGYGDVPVGQIMDGQIVSGSFSGIGQFSIYYFNIPQNSFDFSMIVKGTSGGDPDQAIYNQIPGPGVTPVWINTGSASTSCITAQFPSAGTYYYKLWQAGSTSFSYSNGLFINYGGSCTFSSEIKPKENISQAPIYLSDEVSNKKITLN